MSKNSAIEWTTHTFNPWWGCTRVSPGCERCYAETFAKRVGQKVWGAQAERRFFGDKHWAEPLKWDAAVMDVGDRPRVFCASMADVFEDRRDLDSQRARLFELITVTPSLNWLLLTKRPEKVLKLVPERWLNGFPDHVWMGTTCEDQERANQRVPILRRIPASIHFLSVEPMLGPITLDDRWLEWLPTGPDEYDEPHLLPPIRWVICGAESGHGARPMQEAWARALKDQCERGGFTSFFLKQYADKRGRAISLPVLDGRQWAEFPDTKGIGS